MMDLAGATDLSMNGASPRPNHVQHGGHPYRPLDEMGHEQKTRLPNWTEEEKNVLIVEVRRRAAVLTTPRAKGMSHLKEKAWEEITQAVNAVQAPGSQLRNAQTCRKKWENLKLYAKKAQKEGRNDVTLSTVSQLIGSDMDLKVLQATLQAVQGTSPSPSPGPMEGGPEPLGAIFSVLQQQGMNGALARMLGISGAPAVSEASLSDCSNSVEDAEELRIKSEVVEDNRRHGAADTQRQQENLHGFHDGITQRSSPLPLPPGVSLEPVRKMASASNSTLGRMPQPNNHGMNPQTLNGFHYPHQQRPQQRTSQSPGASIYSNGISRTAGVRHSTTPVSRVNGVKRRREDDSENDDYYLEKRTFYKEMTKLCGTVQNLLLSMKETQQLKQQVLLEKLRIIRLKSSNQGDMKGPGIRQDLDDDENEEEEDDNLDNKRNGLDDHDVSDQDAKDAEERETPDLDDEE
ncbi:uncharacterized protein LOC100905588 [Galendromus occidentalis]|uniref:Regulatory protein zeste n=1 Tax=Galendromus occidentalis TaxID=34638 RepID=A0AAJ7L5E5_9ACAR|nr:uncharacterized protein LOC100905588 [Galendromus occidentalis]